MYIMYVHTLTYTSGPFFLFWKLLELTHLKLLVKVVSLMSDTLYVKGCID